MSKLKVTVVITLNDAEPDEIYDEIIWNRIWDACDMGLDSHGFEDYEIDVIEDELT